MPIYASDTQVTGNLLFATSNLSVTNITSSSAVIGWDTNADSTSQVYYGISSPYSLTEITDNSPQVTHHSVSLSGLNAGTTYHYYVQSTRDGGITVATSTDSTFSTAASNSGGGGGGGGAAGVPSNNGTVAVSGLTVAGNFAVDSNGVVQNGVQLKSSDNILILSVSSGTKLVDSGGKPLTTLSATRVTNLPVDPPQGSVVLAYDFGPNGAKFNPPLTATLSYNIKELPPGTPEGSLIFVFWDGSQWVEIASKVNDKTHTVSAYISHFSLYVLMVNAPSTPTPTKSPVQSYPIPTATITPKSTPNSPASAALLPTPIITLTPEGNNSEQQTPIGVSTPSKQPTPPFSQLMFIYIGAFLVAALSTTLFILMKSHSN